MSVRRLKPSTARGLRRGVAAALRHQMIGWFFVAHGVRRPAHRQERTMPPVRVRRTDDDRRLAVREAFSRSDTFTEAVPVRTSVILGCRSALTADLGLSTGTGSTVTETVNLKSKITYTACTWSKEKGGKDGSAPWEANPGAAWLWSRRSRACSVAVATREHRDPRS